MTKDTVILVRYGEIGLKGKNRPVFEARLVDNMKRVLPPHVAITKSRGRLFVESPSNESIESMMDALSRVFGIVSISPAIRVPLQRHAIAEETLNIAQHFQNNNNRDAFSFKIRARRANKQFPLTSPEINDWLGDEVRQSLKGASVDLEDPDLLLQVEIRQDSAYLTGETIPGPGGLPVGVSGTGLLLLSGGIDSPVAGWQMMKRGLQVEAIHFHTPPFTGPRARQKTEDLANLLAQWGNGLILHLAHFTAISQAIIEYCPRRLHLTIMRRMMVRLAERIALVRDIGTLITGESLGQVASQTLPNLTATSHASRTLPILRPLVGFDKEEIVDRARLIGTYPISILPYQDCCTLFVPDDPKTLPSLEEVNRAERDLPIEQLIDDSLPHLESIAYVLQKGEVKVHDVGD